MVLGAVTPEVSCATFFEVSARWIAQAALVRLQRRDLIHALFAELDASLGGPQADRRQAPWEH